MSFISAAISVRSRTFSARSLAALGGPLFHCLALESNQGDGVKVAVMDGLVLLMCAVADRGGELPFGVHASTSSVWLNRTAHWP